LKGDLGEGMGADLNYTIKRLIRGLTSENHGTKKGFFMASVQVYARFGNQIDLLNLIKYSLELTKTSSTMKNTEQNCMNMGQMMTLSAIIESGLCLQLQNQADNLTQLITALCRIYNDCNFLRESIMVILQKLLIKAKSVSAASTLLGQAVRALVPSDGKKIKFTHPDQISIFCSF
jgi:hypothetical protein